MMQKLAYIQRHNCRLQSISTIKISGKGNFIFFQNLDGKLENYFSWEIRWKKQCAKCFFVFLLFCFSSVFNWNIGSVRYQIFIHIIHCRVGSISDQNNDEGKLLNNNNNNNQNITWRHKLYRGNYENLEIGIDNRRKKLSWNKDPKRYFPRRWSITLTIHDFHDAT